MTTIALRNGARAFWQSSRIDKVTFVAGWFTLGAAAALLRVVPFRRMAPLLGQPAAPSDPTPPVSGAQMARARVVKRAIRRASAVAPFRADCLPQMLTAALLCRLMRVPFAASLGVDLDRERDILAHAWLLVGTTAITGGQTVDRFTPVTRFLFHVRAA